MSRFRRSSADLVVANLAVGVKQFVGEKVDVDLLTTSPGQLLRMQCALPQEDAPQNRSAPHDLNRNGLEASGYHSRSRGVLTMPITEMNIEGVRQVAAQMEASA